MAGKRVIRLFNLIVSHLPGIRESRRALRFVKSVVHGVRVIDTPQSLLLLKVDDPYGAVKAIADSIEPGSTPILRVVPVDVNTRPFLNVVREVVRELASKIPENSSFAVRLEGRLYDESGNPVHRLDAVRAIADPINRPVDLRNPDYLVLVKVVSLSYGQRYAAVMVAPPDSIFSIARVRRQP